MPVSRQTIEETKKEEIERAAPFRRALADEGMAQAMTKTVPTLEEQRTKRGYKFRGTPDWKPLFLKAIAQGMTIGDAEKVAGISAGYSSDYRREHPEYALLYKEAAEIGTEALEQEAARRAHHGVLEPVFYKGVIVGEIRRYSDTLMIFLLKGRKPAMYRDQNEYGKGASINVSVQANVAAVELLNQMGSNIVEVLPDDVRRGIEDRTPLDIASTSGDSGHGGEVEASPPPEGDK